MTRLRGGCFYDDRTFSKVHVGFSCRPTEVMELCGVRLVRCIRRAP